MTWFDHNIANALKNNQIVRCYLIQTICGLFSFILCRMAFSICMATVQLKELRREFAFAQLYGASHCHALSQTKHNEYCTSSLDNWIITLITKKSDSVCAHFPVLWLYKGWDLIFKRVETWSCYSQPPAWLPGSSDGGAATQKQTGALCGKSFTI